ncbi:3-phosphoshikimate 1-carboxyvinyltransferase [Campylobacter cuniculorum]|uniref:3-phosphoshikimate 1-carboxyvinyltransferase n=2 Tax=Campylobacter cuniculorum TaxID=374106 RepID=A0A1W6BWS1_9BACT|nr:3-phosphoshikimate 1-carboxyvinyltransferase [Campylobacter cuniculorum]ARJ56525.1 3-phosphoshikimate 1-carboxyvinyltransferase [Campylobacter cuniculorum DSM 23162 = LMG 24588]QOR04009.1 3-phosphoshikimate 1-carboxyvinyltransferase [Campylobacter cuniculorum]
MKINILENFNAQIQNLAADKSISHRFAIFSLLTNSTNRAKNYLLAEDTLNTLEIIKNLGAKVERKEDEVKIIPPLNISSPNCVLECGNSGTAMRLMIGFLSALEGFFVLSGDQYLNNRPMKRICEPLKKIGAKIYGREYANLAPLCIEGAKLEAFDYMSEISSAQVKTAMILAAFNAKQTCYFKERELSRNHSENMLKAMQAPLKVSQDGLSLEIQPLKEALKPLDIIIPNDPSSAFYFVLATILLPHSKICIKNILLNPTRIEAYKVLEKMGAKITYKFYENSFESIGEIYAQSSELKAVEVSERISWLIDEAPALAIAFSQAKGTSILRNAKELRVKESDRIRSVVENLKKCGIDAQELEDGFKITGGVPQSAKIQSFADHRIAMSFAILGLICGIEIDDEECIQTSFPNFKDILKNLGVKIDY